MSASFAYVSSASRSSQSGGSTTSVFPSFNLSSGDLVVVFASWAETSALTATISDTAGNTYTQAGSYARSSEGGDDYAVGLWYCLNPTGNASNVVTVTYSGTATYREGCAASYSYSGSIELGDTSSGSNTSDVTPWTTSPDVSAVNGDLIVGGFGFYDPVTANAGTGFTKRNTTTDFSIFEERFPSTTETVTVQAQNTGSADSYAGLGAVFQAVAGDITASPTGVAGTGAVGSLSITTDTSFSLTGVSGTGQVGTLTTAAGLTVEISGNSATGSVGTLSPIWDSAISITGVGGTGAVGTLSVTAGNLVEPTGVEGTGQVGSLSFVSDVTLTIAGVGGIGAVGDVTTISGTSLELTGVTATGAIGTLSVQSDVSVAISGNSATGAVGDISIPSDGSASLTGVSATGAIGTLTINAAGSWTIQSVTNGTWTLQTTDNSAWSAQSEDDTTWTEQ